MNAGDNGDLPKGVVSADEWSGIGNEFTGVRFRKVRTRHGERLELWSPKAETRVLLDPVALEAVTLQDPRFFSRLIADHHGAGGE